MYFFFSSKSFLWSFLQLSCFWDSQVVPLLCSCLLQIFVLITAVLKSLFGYSDISFISLFLLIFPSATDAFSCSFAHLPRFLIVSCASWMLYCWVSGFYCFPLRKVELYFGICLIYLWISFILSFVRVGLALSLFWGCNHASLRCKLLVADLNTMCDQYEFSTLVGWNLNGS